MLAGKLLSTAVTRVVTPSIAATRLNLSKTINFARSNHTSSYGSDYKVPESHPIGAKPAFQFTAEEHELIKDPKKWIGKSCDQIFRLYRLRKFTLRTSWSKNDDELDALLSVCVEKNIRKDHMRIFYLQGREALNKVLPKDERLNEGWDFIKIEPALSMAYQELPTPAHQQIDYHRDVREYNRIAAYEFPQLAKYVSEYRGRKDPVDGTTKALRFKYSTFMGEKNHDGNNKVIVEFKVADIEGLNEIQSHKLKLLAGVRYDYRNDQVKIAGTMFSKPAQNKKYVSDVIDKLIAEAKVDAEKFVSVPLDKRHIMRKEAKQHKSWKNQEFPQEWLNSEFEQETTVTMNDLIRNDK
ncbi:hypothetical protein NADFUDRAFT_81431 [Nadsonia fulvescens var. elongata DSM 6958]|uniref:Small ribosomal subunit protein mS35 mitochondrial conserved domain-containing protein n=1 Tax=Nadsonia fulvescens var. elongata DSM 6958 TaxID=857566 RepID=A0A1E3PT64_9ASCO|nr:hypothetical protein NADFUDRAFT_81431 [Nadsonia fulvescens var. elongata DSM 6958]